MVILVRAPSPALTSQGCVSLPALRDTTPSSSSPHPDYIHDTIESESAACAANILIDSSNSSSSHSNPKLAATPPTFPMPESAELSVLSPPSVHHNTPKITNSTWNARRHLKLNLNLSQQQQQCLHHQNNHHHSNNNHRCCSGAGGGVPYNNMINIAASGRSSSVSPKMPRHEMEDPMSSKKSKLDFCQLPIPVSTPASSLPGNQVHNNLHNSQLHLQCPSSSSSSGLHPKANRVCYLQQNSSSPLSPPSQPFGHRNNSSSPNSHRRRSSSNNHHHHYHHRLATSPTSALINYTRTSPVSSPEMTNCGCGLVCTSLGCASSPTSTPSPYCLSSRAKVKPISGHDLSAMIATSRSHLIVDVRSAESYNNNHIRGALNLCCDDAFNRRRIQMGRTSVLNILGVRDSGLSSAAKRRSRHNNQMDIVVYDDHSCFEDLHEPNQHSALCTVLSSLLRDGRDVFVLEGGLKRFVLENDDMCASITRSPDHNKSVLYSPTNGIHRPDGETDTASQVLPFLYLGNERDAKDLNRLRSLNIGYVLNVTSHVPQYHDGQGIRYKRIPASDSAQQDLRQYFEEAIEYIDDARQNNANVLVHCHAGVSRSATVTIAYLLKHTRMAMADAYKFVKGKRGIISPNFNFMGQLLEFEHDLNDGVSPRILQPRLTGIESSV